MSWSTFILLKQINEVAHPAFLFLSLELSHLYPICKKFKLLYCDVLDYIRIHHQDKRLLTNVVSIA